jgi:hypothetical protein
MKYMLFFLVIALIFKIFSDKVMMVLAICMVNGNDCKHYFLKIVTVLTMFIVLLIDYN